MSIEHHVTSPRGPYGDAEAPATPALPVHEPEQAADARCEAPGHPDHPDSTTALAPVIRLSAEPEAVGNTDIAPPRRLATRPQGPATVYRLYPQEDAQERIQPPHASPSRRATVRTQDLAKQVIDIVDNKPNHLGHRLAVRPNGELMTHLELKTIAAHQELIRGSLEELQQLRAAAAGRALTQDFGDATGQLALADHFSSIEQMLASEPAPAAAPARPGLAARTQRMFAAAKASLQSIRARERLAAAKQGLSDAVPLAGAKCVAAVDGAAAQAFSSGKARTEAYVSPEDKRLRRQTLACAVGAVAVVAIAAAIGSKYGAVAPQPPQHLGRLPDLTNAMPPHHVLMPPPSLPPAAHLPSPALHHAHSPALPGERLSRFGDTIYNHAKDLYRHHGYDRQYKSVDALSRAIVRLNRLTSFDTHHMAIGQAFKVPRLIAKLGHHSARVY